MTREYTGNEVAVIGIACRFPQSPDWQRYWQNLIAGRELVSFFSRDELLAAGTPAEVVDLPGYVPAKAFLEDADCFDAAFFGYSQREAQKMDPQLRVLHELCHNAFLDAGQRPGASALNAGVFLGSTLNLGRLERFRGASEDILELFDVGNYNDPAAFAAQIAYRMKLVGPAVNVQTACSTSLSAVHMACKALLAGECDLALAGGACITDPAAAGYLYRDGMILSPDGRCRPFSDQGNGTVNGNGAGVVLLKLLEQALADGDPVHAVIVESAMNNDGDRKVSFEAPSVPGQSDVIAQVYRVADIPFSSLGLIEAHGTATVLGDPIEIQALNKAARELIPAQELAAFRCAVGSVKSNMGHLDSAAGIAGLIKAALSVRFGRIPPSLHYARPNPHLDLHKTPFWVPAEASDWPEHQPIRRAGVSSFGIGGTNVHVLLEQPPVAEAYEVSSSDVAQLLPLSADSPEALARLVAAYSAHLDVTRAESPRLDPIARQLQQARTEHACRGAFVAATPAQWQAQLDAWALTDGAGQPAAGMVWLFPGQGTQLPGMGLRLAEAFPEFGAIYLGLLRHAATLLALEPEALIAAVRDPQQCTTQQIQPMLYAVQTALGLWLQRLGCVPSALCGFSLGEFAAAAVAGVFTPEQGLELVVARARLMDGLPGGAIFAVSSRNASNAEFPALFWRIAELSPGTWTLATAQHDVAEAEAWLAAHGHAWKRVAVSQAFHTPLVEPAAAAFGELLRGYALQPARYPIYSTALGRRIDADAMRDPGYWVAQMRSPVQWSAALAQLGQDHPHALHAQIGSGADLLQHARKWLRLDARRLVATLGSAAADEVPSLLQYVATYWSQGGKVAWDVLQAAETAAQPLARSHLPGHAFERRPCEAPALAPADRNVASAYFGAHYYGLEWEKVSLAAPEPAAAAGTAPATWIFCAEAGERERALASALASDPARLRFVECAAACGPAQTSHADLEAWLTQQSLQIDGPTDILVTGLLDELDAAQAQFWAFWLPTAIARWSAANNASQRLRLVFATTGLAACGGSTTLDAHKSQLHGPLLILPEEYPAIRTLCVDLDQADAAAVIAALRPWLQRDWQGGQFCCFRNGAYWQRRLSARVQQQAAPQVLPDLRRSSWVLVTGANGGMGAAIAEHLAEVYHCNLLLQLRTALPRRQDWDAEIAGGGRHAELLRWVRRLEAQANRVVLLQADLGDEAALAQAFAPVLRMAQRGVGIDYVFHTAGRGEGALLQLRSEAESIATLAPKVDGTRFLCTHLAQLGHPTLLLFSSLGNLLPKEKVGQIAYVAANACLEAYAEQVRQAGGRALAIAWDDWAEAGMATRSAQQLDRALNAPTPAVAADATLWRRTLSAAQDWWLDEHRVDDATTVMPAMGMVALLHRALAETPDAPAGAFALQDLTIERPLVVSDATQRDVAVVFTAGHAAFEIHSGEGEFSRETWQRHASGRIAFGPALASPEQAAAAVPLHRLFAAEDGYGVSPRAALRFGQRWRNVIAVDQTADGAIVNRLQLAPAFAGEAQAEGLHVALLDTATLIASPLDDGAQFAPISIGAFRQFAPLQDRVDSEVRVQDLGAGKLLQVRIRAPQGELLVAIDDLLLVDASATLRQEQTSIGTEASQHRVMRLSQDAQGAGGFAFTTRLEPRRAPGPQEVEIRVAAAGLNFKDVLIALGVLPAPVDPAMTFGQEAAGIVTRVGAEVTHLRVGDRVMCAGHSCLAEHVLMPARVVAPVPPMLGLQQAAGVPVAFTTAWIALKHAANLRRGDRILIHSAAGGVGMAALQIALHLGAEVWVTAGSEEKRRLLLGLGAKGAANSRTREFGEVFRQQLGERPFDVILNALAGELLEESVALLAPQGRFLELGLKDILQNWQLGLSIFAEGGSFHAVQAGAEHPAYREAWAEVVALLREETLRPLPTQVYAAGEVAEAFRFMAQGRHVGKIVVAMAAPETARSFVDKLHAEGLRSAEGVRIAMAMAALARSTVLPYVAVSKLPAGTVLEKQLHTQQMLFGSAAPQTPTAAADGVASLVGADAETLLQAMRAMLQDFLGADALDVDASFFALGATSLDLIQFARKLEQRLAREIPVALLFKAASLRELSRELAPGDAVAPVPAAPQQSAEDKRRVMQARRKLRGGTSRQEDTLQETEANG